MKKLVVFSVTHPVTTTMACAALILLGFLGVLRLETALLPDINYPMLTVVTRFPDESPSGIEKRITKPVEEALSGVRGLTATRSTSSQGVSIVRLTFGWKTDIDFAAMEVREKLDLVRNSLPQDAERPVVLKYDPNAAPLLTIACSPNSKPDTQLRDFIERNIKPAIRRIDGVGGVKISGGHIQEIHVKIDPGKLYAVQMTLPDVVQLIARANFNTPAGPLPEGTREVMVRTIGEFNRISEIGDVLIPAEENSAPFRLSQLADITDGFQDRKSDSLYNTEPAVGLSVYAESSANKVATAERVRAVLKKLQQSFTTRLKLNVVIDRSEYISTAINDVAIAALVGGLLAFLVLVVFLKSVPEALILSLSIPVCVATTLFLMFLSGITLNLISLGGLALGMGMTVDSGIVVIENIKKRMDGGEDKKNAVINGAGEMAAPVFASILTSIAVFLPIVFVEGLSGRLFGQMALTVSFSLLVSIFTALSFIPTAMLHVRTGKKILQQHEGAWISRLEKLIRKKKTVLLFSLGFFAAAIPLYLLLDQEFIPAGKRQLLKARLHFSSDMPLERKTILAAKFVKTILAHVPEGGVFSEIGIDDTDPVSAASEQNPYDAYLSIAIPGHDPDTMVARLRSAFPRGFDVPFSIEQDNTLIEGITTTTPGQVSLRISGEDDKTRDLLKTTLAALRKSGLFTSVTSDTGEIREEVAIKVDRRKSASLGISVKDIAAAVRIALSGDVATKFRKDDRTIDVRVRFSDQFRQSGHDLSRIFLRTAAGALIPIQQLTTFDREDGESRLFRVQGKRSGLLTMAYRKNMETRALNLLQRKAAELRSLQGTDVEIEGHEEQSENLQGLLFAFLLAIVLVYMVLASQFESFGMPLVVMISLPFSFIGSFLLLFLFNRTINVISAMGLIMLAGIAVNNAIVLYDKFISGCRQGLEPGKAAASASVVRLRPILMTTFTTLLGMAPLVFAGASLQRDLAIAVVGGLISSTLLTLLLLPVFFTMTSRKKA